MTADQEPDQPVTAGSPGHETRPVLAEQSSEDTDLGWGEAPESDDERLNRERPPHW